MSENSSPSHVSWFSRLTHSVHNLYVWGVSVAVVYAWYATGSAPDKEAAIGEYKLKILTWAISILPIVLFLFLMYFAITYGRKAKYGEVMGHLHSIQHELRDLFSEMREFQREHNIPSGNEIPVFVKTASDSYRKMFNEKMQSILSRFAYCYGITSGVNCRASIKLIGMLDKNKGSSVENLYIRTLVRDINSTSECKKKDVAEKNEDHLVSDNTDFLKIVRQKRSYYFSGNINAEDDYENSSLKFWEQHNPMRTAIRKKIPILSRFLEFLKPEWGSLFPYVSVIVLPIRCKEGSEGLGVPIGFLSVDSKSRKCFWERYDVHLGASIADSIYHVLEEYTLFNSKLQELAKEANNAPK